MNCGDETGALVIDVGAQNARFGYAGEDAPKIVFNTASGVTSDLLASQAAAAGGGAAQPTRTYHVGPAARLPRPGMEVRSPFDLGLVEDFGMLGAVWDYGVAELRCDPREHPLIIVEPSHLFRSHREELVRKAFEEQGAPAVYLAKAPVMQAFALGRATGMVVDIGASGTRVVGVYDGHVLKQGTVISEVGGQALSDALHEAILKSSSASSSSSGSGAGAGGAADGAVKELVPRVMLRKTQVVARPASAAASAGGGSGMEVDQGGAGAGSASVPAAATSSSSSTKPIWDIQRRTDLSGITRSYVHNLVMEEILDDIKRSGCTITDVGFGEEGAKPSPKEHKFELPDGTVLRLKNQLQVVPELLFRPGTYWKEFQVTLQRHQNSQAWHALYAQDIIKRERPHQSHHPSIQQMLYSSLLSSPVEIRKELCHHIVLTGGGSLLKGLPERMKWESIALIPPAFKPRILQAAPVERQFGSWIGASILASLGSFNQMWISKQEFEEQGAAYAVDARCA